MKIQGKEIDRSLVSTMVFLVADDGNAGNYRVAYFIDKNLIIRATRRRYKGKILKHGPVEIVFTIGKPNFAERKLIRRRGPKVGYVVESVKK